MPTETKILRVWWIRNPPNHGDRYPVKTLQEAKKIIDLLTQEDLKNERIFANAGGLEELDPEDGEWYEWYNEDGEGINDLVSGG